MADDQEMTSDDQISHLRFYDSFVDLLKWAVVAIAVLLIVMAVFLA